MTLGQSETFIVSYRHSISDWLKQKQKFSFIKENPETYQLQKSCLIQGRESLRFQLYFSSFLTVLFLSAFELGLHARCINASKSDWQTPRPHNWREKNILKNIVPTEQYKTFLSKNPMRFQRRLCDQIYGKKSISQKISSEKVKVLNSVRHFIISHHHKKNGECRTI